MSEVRYEFGSGWNGNYVDDQTGRVASGARKKVEPTQVLCISISQYFGYILGGRSWDRWKCGYM